MTQEHSPAFLAYSERCNAAALDPDFKKKRERVVTRLRRDMHAVLEPVGYSCEGLVWVKTSPQGQTRVSIYRMRAGYQARIEMSGRKTGFSIGLAVNGVLRRIGQRLGNQNPILPYKEQVVTRLQPFYRLDEHKHHPEKGSLEYALIDEDPSELDLPIEILAHRALPWLEGCHRRGALPEVPKGFWEG